MSSALMLCELPPHAAGAVVVATEESPAELDGDALYMPEVVVEELSDPVAIPAADAVMKISAEWLPDGDVLAARVGTTGPVAARWMSRLSAEAVTPARTAGLRCGWMCLGTLARARVRGSNTSRRRCGGGDAVFGARDPGRSGRRSWDGVCARADLAW